MKRNISILLILIILILLNGCYKRGKLNKFDNVYFSAELSPDGEISDTKLLIHLEQVIMVLILYWDMKLLYS